MKTWILTIGNELLVGRILDTNSNWLSKQLTRMGYHVDRIIILPDREDAIVETFQEAYKKCDVIILTGGLGPTYDDITSYSLSKALNKRWILNQEALEMVKERLRKFNLDLNEYRIKMAKMPEGATPLENRVGVAPGIFLKEDDKLIFALPGVPDEMKHIFAEHVRKILLQHISREYYVEEKITFRGYPESSLAPILENIASKYENAYIKSHPQGVYKNKPVVDIVVAVWAESIKDAKKLAMDIISEIRDDVGNLK